MAQLTETLAGLEDSALRLHVQEQQPPGTGIPDCPIAVTTHRHPSCLTAAQTSLLLPLKAGCSVATLARKWVHSAWRPLPHFCLLGIKVILVLHLIGRA